MNVENIDRVRELIEQRAQLLAIIEKLESDEITFNGEDGLPFETPPECVINKMGHLQKCVDYA